MCSYHIFKYLTAKRGKLLLDGRSPKARKFVPANKFTILDFPEFAIRSPMRLKTKKRDETDATDPALLCLFCIEFVLCVKTMTSQAFSTEYFQDGIF